jgi:hypothetical protein
VYGFYWRFLQASPTGVFVGTYESISARSAGTEAWQASTDAWQFRRTPAGRRLPRNAGTWAGTSGR